MNTTTAIATTTEVSEKQQSAWLLMAAKKNELVAELQNRELKAQSILLPVIGSESYQHIDNALAEYRKHHTEMVEVRKAYTAAIESGIIQPLMAFEKRIDPKTNEAYIEASNESLRIRKEEADRTARINQKNEEFTRFKTHVQNEFFRIAAMHRATLRKEIYTQYEMAIKAKQMPDLATIADMLFKVPYPTVEKFRPILLTGDEMLAEYKKIPGVDWDSIIADAKQELHDVFANFASDLKNAKAALAHQKEQAQLAEIKAQKKLDEERALNTLIATSETVVIDAPKIKTTVKLVVVESEAWAKAVMAGFITNMPHLIKYIRTKSWSKLTIGQMAEYLGKLATDEGVTINNLQYKEISK